MKYFHIILIFIFATAAVNALECYVCRSDKTDDCFDISKGQKKHIQNCTVSNTCAMIETRDLTGESNVVRERLCYYREQCKFYIFGAKCCTCKTDACNHFYCSGGGFGTFSLGFGSLIFASIFIVMSV